MAINNYHNHISFKQYTDTFIYKYNYNKFVLIKYYNYQFHIQIIKNGEKKLIVYNIYIYIYIHIYEDV